MKNLAYWDNCGKHQARLDELTKLIPDTGESNDPLTETLRLAQNVYYDFANNGGCNISGGPRAYDWIGLIYWLDRWEYNNVGFLMKKTPMLIAGHLQQSAIDKLADEMDGVLNFILELKQ